MNVDKSTYWLFVLFRNFFILLSWVASANIHPIPFNRWKDSNHRHFVQSTSEAQRDDFPQTISYKLDSWSQYDNPEEGNAREGDIMHYPTTRKTMTSEQELLWPDGIIRYFIDDTIVNESAKLSMLEDAMENIMELTCVKFVRIYPDSNGRLPFDSWVNITGNDEGCYADLGRSTFSGTIINLDVKKCFRTKGHALHEILHTLGVFHEHMRPDRDEHITILWDNIKEGESFNFDVLDDNTVTTYGLPYDYESIMHYSMTAFSKNKSMPTIVPNRKDVEIGQRSHLSLYDVLKVLIAYNCNNVDMEYIYDKVNQERKNDVALLEKILSFNTAADNPIINDRKAKTRKSLKDSELMCSKSTGQTNIPNILEAPYEFFYPRYNPNPYLLHYFYYDYGSNEK